MKWEGRKEDEDGSMEVGGKEGRKGPLRRECAYVACGRHNFVLTPRWLADPGLTLNFVLLHSVLQNVLLFKCVLLQIAYWVTGGLQQTFVDFSYCCQ